MKWQNISIFDQLRALFKLILLYLSCYVIFTAVAKADAADDAIDSVATGAQDTIDTTTKILKNLTCETQGIGELLSAEFSHTCIPAPFSTFAVAEIVSPVLYPNMILRLKINDTELFGVSADPSDPNSTISSPCARQNRIDYRDQKISFGLCNNILLAKASTKAVANSAVAIASAALTGSDPWESIKDSWNIPKKDYHEIHEDVKEGAEGIMFDIGAPVAFPWKVIADKDRMCVATYGLTGLIPVGCKYIKEPFPQSIYSSFMDAPDVVGKTIDIISDTGLISKANDPTALIQCGAAGSCFNKAYSISKAPIVISSPLIECIKQMTAKLLVSEDVCSFDDLNQVINSPKRESSSLFQFQRNMHRAVTAFLSLYVILWGFKIILAGNVPPKNEIITFVLKIIFVVYFAVGINITPNSNNDYDRLDGMTGLAFPFLLGGVSQISNWIMDASPSDLCKFATNEYPSGMAHMAVWDSLDCRVSHYLGLDILSTMLAEEQARKHDFSHSDGLSFPIPPYLYLLVPAIITGQTTLISLAIMFPLLIISVSAFMINATIVCLIGIVILGMLAPLFVPMLLFEYTKGYFESWIKLLISFMLQPMIISSFIITMFSVYDFGFYGTCKYIYTPLATDDRTVKAYFIDNNWDKYANIDAVNGCKNSLGYMLNNPQSLQTGLTGVAGIGVSTGGDPVQNIANTAKHYKDLIKNPIANIPVLQYLSRFDFLAFMSNPTGMFFQYPLAQFEQIKNMILSLVTACLVLYLMYNFSAQLTEFAADLTEGVSLSGSAITPQTVFKYGMKAAGAAGKAGAFAGKASKVVGAGASKIAGSVTRAGLKSIADKGTDMAKDKISSGAISKAKDLLSVEGGSSAKSTGNSSAESSQTDKSADSKLTSFLSKEEIGKIAQSRGEGPKAVIISSHRISADQAPIESVPSTKPRQEQETISKQNAAENNPQGAAISAVIKDDITTSATTSQAQAAQNKLDNSSEKAKTATNSAEKTKAIKFVSRTESTIEDKLKNSSLAQDRQKKAKDES